MLLNVLYILIGFVLLVKGGDFLVDGSVAIARWARLSAMVIGLTVVGFGTSMPELLVSTQAAWMGSSGIAIGNVVGSNIANIALILGVTALICPLPASRRMMRVDIPFMLMSLVLFTVAAHFGSIYRWEGILMVLLLIGFVSWEVRQSRRENKAAELTQEERERLQQVARMEEREQEAALQKPMALWKAILLVLVSLVAMVVGSRLLVYGSTEVAWWLGRLLSVPPFMMERIIGLTIVAVGTSLPELFASVMAARKGETDMAVGNIIGSVTFNILCVVGVASAITPIPHAWMGFGPYYALMLLLGFLLWWFLHTKKELGRWEGVVLFIIYVVFLAWTANF